MRSATGALCATSPFTRSVSRSPTGPVANTDAVPVDSPSLELVGLLPERLTEPIQRSLGWRVMRLTTPPSASEPYSADMGPRMTSMRSMADMGSQPYW